MILCFPCCNLHCVVNRAALLLVHSLALLVLHCDALLILDCCALLVLDRVAHIVVLGLADLKGAYVSCESMCTFFGDQFKLVILNVENLPDH